MYNLVFNDDVNKFPEQNDYKPSKGLYCSVGAY